MGAGETGSGIQCRIRMGVHVCGKSSVQMDKHVEVDMDGQTQKQTQAQAQVYTQTQ